MCIHHFNTANLAHPGIRVEQKVDYRTAGSLKPSRMVQLVYSNILKEKTSLQYPYKTPVLGSSAYSKFPSLKEFDFLLFQPKTCQQHPGSMVGSRNFQFKGEINPLTGGPERANQKPSLWQAIVSQEAAQKIPQVE